MKWESFKTLLLTVLVILSFVLTWNLWTYKSDYSTIEQPDYINSAIVSNGKSSLREVIHPIQAIYHADEEHYGLQSGNQLHDMFQAVVDAEFHDVIQVNKDSAEPKLKRNLREPDANDVEMIFPAAISMSLFEHILQGNNAEGDPQKELGRINQDMVFDRIVFYKIEEDQKTNMKAYFKNGTTTVATSRVNNVSFADLKSYYEDQNVYIAKKLDGRTIYLPADPKVKEVRYAYTWIDTDKIVNALFNSPHVERKGIYRSSSEYLKVDRHIIKYFNAKPGAEQLKNEDVGHLSIVQESFEFINGHSGWTHSYMLFGYETATKKRAAPLDGAVTFRLMIGAGQNETKYPVFSDISGFYPYSDAGTMLVSWENGEVHEYIRTQMNVQEALARTGNRDFKTGNEVWEQLNDSPKVQMNQVKNIRIGYQMTYPPRPNAVNTVSFVPKWFVLYNGTWISANELTKPEKKTQEGNA